MDGQLNRSDAGVTLIELVVVVAIMAVLAVGVSLVPLGSGANAAAQDAAQFQTRITALADRAVHGRAVTGLRITARGMQAVEQSGDRWRDLGPPEAWAGRVTLVAALPAGGAPDIVLLPGGRSSVFDISFGDRRCTSTGWGPVQCPR